MGGAVIGFRLPRLKKAVRTDIEYGIQADGVTIEEYMEGVPQRLSTILQGVLGGRHILINNRHSDAEAVQRDRERVLTEVCTF